MIPRKGEIEMMEGEVEDEKWLYYYYGFMLLLLLFILLIDITFYILNVRFDYNIRLYYNILLLVIILLVFNNGLRLFLGLLL